MIHISPPSLQMTDSLFSCVQMTICIVALLNGKTKDEWYAWVKERVENNVGWDTPEEIAPVFQSQGGTGQGTDGPALTMGGGQGGAGAGGFSGFQGGGGFSDIFDGVSKKRGGSENTSQKVDE